MRLQFLSKTRTESSAQNLKCTWKIHYQEPQMALLGKLQSPTLREGLTWHPMAPSLVRIEHQKAPRFWQGLNAEHSLDCTDTGGH